ncbi:hypothetical protein HMPREF3226_00349 [Prevotella corporis]|uniref:Uncharacterized protein n=1 Tax=Prevotella corporis TaxID=28128 RepID=A0A133QMB7_9BACT|nr:hypothetical protein HMPREF3226_00349 [Prevotella corporis]
MSLCKTKADLLPSERSAMMLQKVSYDVAKSQLYINRCRGVVVLSRDSHLSIRLAAPIFSV